jgi:phenylalanyl-tRNA synthetase beta subunit
LFKFTFKFITKFNKTAQENLNQGNLFIEGFEYGHVFSGNIGTDFQEQEYVAGIFGGIRTKLTWSESTKALTWFEAKGKMEQIFKQLNLSINWKICSSLMFKEFYTLTVVQSCICQIIPF